MSVNMVESDEFRTLMHHLRPEVVFSLLVLFRKTNRGNPSVQGPWKKACHGADRCDSREGHQPHKVVSPALATDHDNV